MMVEVIVEFDYIANEPDELTIKKGDIIKDVVKKKGGWWEGVLNQKKGMFPDNFVRPLEKDSSVSLRNKKDVLRIRQCRVVFSYNQDHEDELNLKVGDIIDIIGEEEEGWWKGSLNGKQGVFPSNFVEEIPWQPHASSREVSLATELDLKAPTLPAKPVKQLCEAKFPYKAQNEDELSFKEGDIIVLINKDSQDPGWWQGELNGKIGVFPDNFVIPISSAEDRSNIRDDNKSSRIVTEKGAIKPSSIASQRKSLEIKNDKKSEVKNDKKSEAKNDKVNLDPSPTSNKSPPIPGKKPSISLKKSPSGTSPGLFSEIKKKLVDVVDGATSSKNSPPKTEQLETKDNSSENAFDQVERRPLLTDVRATRVKAPGRRLPTTVHKDDEDHSIPNGNVDHFIDSSEVSLGLHVSETDGEKPRLREWEKHKAPWLEEMKLNQAKRTSISPGPENKPGKLAPMTERSIDVEDLKPNKLSPLEKEVDMSKSMPSLELSKSLNSKLKTSPSELEKVPLIKSKPAISTVITHRQSAINNNIKELPPAPNRHTISMPSMIAKDNTTVKPPAPSPPKVSPVTSVASKSPVSSEKIELVKPNTDIQENITSAQYIGILERLQKLEILVEKQNQTIEELKNKLQLETDMRMLLQEKVMQNVQV
ncbi:CIN85 and CD2AP related [Leptinotarsa decemlineata]|uniref:CIN85 and CD2AP related n=1 Tax=Leptinotarsa decemlineata TaxID=7539 RepID=UPI000C2552AD|nr:SH3 domain-containing kinase-binding protein 1-like [Leptinotarsa decemlineata]